MGLVNSTLLLYSLLAISLLLLLLALCLALVVFLRGDEVKPPKPQETLDPQRSAVQQVQEDGPPPQGSKGQFYISDGDCGSW